jgi:Uma2 family endonuclease
MGSIPESPPPLVTGDKLSRDEFLRRWEAHPEIKFAELIGGVVYMPSPLSRDHGVVDSRVGTWLGVYSAWTPGTESGNNATTLMLEQAPQPEVYLRILPEHGGKSGMAGKYVQGAAELLTEVSLSSASYDLHEKLQLYEEARVQEYVAVLVEERAIRWHILSGDRFTQLASGDDGIYRSIVFPGLWLDGSALLSGDMRRVLAVLQQGLATPEHAAFGRRLAAAKKP